VPEPASGVASGTVTASSPHSGHSLPPGASMGDRRGLTATGAVALALLLGIAGGAFDVLTGPGLREVFAVSFVSGCVLAAMLVHREDLVAAVVMPPLVYVVLVLIGGAVERTAASGSFVTRQAIELVNAMVLGAPVLMAATAAAALVALVRTLTARR
jgi:hypothetical protein